MNGKGLLIATISGESPRIVSRDVEDTLHTNTETR